jgi:hypothetical protein
MLSRVPAMIAAALCIAPATNSQPDSSQKEFVASDELNGRLPRWVRFSGELRERMEAVTRTVSAGEATLPVCCPACKST